MTPSPGPITASSPGGPSRVIQGYFPGGRPRIVQASAAPRAPVEPRLPGGGPARPGFPPEPIVPGHPRTRTLQPVLGPGRPAQPILLTRARTGAVQPATRRHGPPLPRPILPQPSRTATVQPQAGEAFALPANFMLKPRGSGQPLPDPIQKKMEAFFNTSFADVRIHVGHEAPSIGALAFTHGTDLYFAPGQFNPQTPRGQQLLGHELTHVVQQSAGRVRNPLGSGLAVVQDPALEAEAERMGLRAALHQPPVQTKLANPVGAILPNRAAFPLPSSAGKATSPRGKFPSVKRPASHGLPTGSVQRMQSLPDLPATTVSPIASNLGPVPVTILTTASTLPARDEVEEAKPDFVPNFVSVNHPNGGFFKRKSWTPPPIGSKNTWPRDKLFYTEDFTNESATLYPCDAELVNAYWDAKITAPFQRDGDPDWRYSCGDYAIDDVVEDVKDVKVVLDTKSRYEKIVDYSDKETFKRDLARLVAGEYVFNFGHHFIKIVVKAADVFELSQKDGESAIYRATMTPQRTGEYLCGKYSSGTVFRKKT
jgi:hypothetical protein